MPDTTGPTLSVSSLNSQYGTNSAVVVEATASDTDSGLAQVEYFIDDVSIRTVGGGETSFVSFSTSSYCLGTHTLKVVATDVAANTTTQLADFEIVVYVERNDIGHTEWFFPSALGHVEETSNVEELRIRPEDIDILPEEIQSCSEIDYSIQFAKKPTADQFYPPVQGSFYIPGGTIDLEGFYHIIGNLAIDAQFYPPVGGGFYNLGGIIDTEGFYLVIGESIIDAQFYPPVRGGFYNFGGIIDTEGFYLVLKETVCG